MNRTKLFVFNAISTAFLQLIVMLVGFILPKVMLKYYGSEINGLVSSITQFITYFSLVEAGLASAAVYALYKPLAQKDIKQTNEVVSITKKFYYTAGFIFGILVICLALIYPLIITTNLFNNIEIFLLVLVIGLSGIIDFFSLSKYRVLLTADQKTYVISIATIIYYFVYTAIIIILAKIGWNITLVRFVSVLAVLLRSLILYLYVKCHYKAIDYNVKTSNKKLLNKRWDALYLQILGSIQQGAPVVILTIVSELTVVSIYTIYNMVIGGINGILSIFTSGLSSSFGDIIVKNETETLKKAIGEFEYIYYDLITIVYSTALIMIMSFIKIYTLGITDVNYYIPLVGVLFVINGLMYNIKTPQGMLVIAAGMYKETKWQSTVQGLIIIVAGVILTPIMGIAGILIAMILSNVYRDIDLLLFIPKKLTKLPIKNTFIRQIKIFLYSAIILLLSMLIPINNSVTYTEWTAYAILVVAMSVAVVVVFDFIFDRKQLRAVFKRMESMVKKHA